MDMGVVPYSYLKLSSKRIEDKAFFLLSIFLESSFPDPKIENLSYYSISKHFSCEYVIFPHCSFKTLLPQL